MCSWHGSLALPVWQEEWMHPLILPSMLLLGTRYQTIPTMEKSYFQAGRRRNVAILDVSFDRRQRKSEAFRIDFCLLVSYNFHLFVIKRSQINWGWGGEGISTFGRLQGSLGLFICSVTHFRQTFFFYLLS